MIFGDAPQPSEARELLAWWSDILGIVGFFVSVAGVAVALIVRQQVRQARREATGAIALFLWQSTLRDIGFARQAVLLAREACRGKQWMRAHGHFDIAIDFVTRLLGDSNHRQADWGDLPKTLDNLRALSEVVGTRISESNLSGDRLALLDEEIRKLTLVEVAFRRFDPKVIP